MLDSSAARWTGIAVSAALGYAAVGRLYRHVRGRCEPGSDEKWVCPGVGAAGALTAGGLAAYVLAGRGETARASQGCPALAEAGATIGLPKFSIGN